jgi:acetyltransferase-like isoleucine patch superfamily enzyme
MRVGNGVFIGPNVTFCNDKYPKSKNKDYVNQPVVIGNNVSIGANSTILPGICIGDNSVIGAGAIVVKDVPCNVKVIGVYK